MTRIAVVGSINMDLVTMSPRFPLPGETIHGERFLTIPGGKGANQAVAAARLGARVALVGAVGSDAFGRTLRDGLLREGVDLAQVVTREHCESGTASIVVASGENQIIVVPGANAQVTPAQVEGAQATLAAADVILVQLEIPVETVEATLRLAARLQKPVVLNPAPAQPLASALLAQVRYLTPNQHELATVLGSAPDDDFHALMARAPCPVVLTRGSDGAWYREHGNAFHQPGFSVDVVDTTGAGDTFNAALAVYLHRGLPAAVKLACAAAALSVSRLGAQGGMPAAAETERLSLSS
jgi:ribokinase